jgi:hypothetical protein
MTSLLFSRAVGPTRDPARAGAVWIAGTGAFLLLVASAVFVASNWDRIPPAAKLAAIGLLTGSFLLAGRSLRRSLPGTSGALYHLGAFLIPVDVAALGVHLGASAPQLAVTGGVVCGIAWWLLDRLEPSLLLRWGAAGAVVVTAAGVGGVTGLPAGLCLAGAAVVALLLDVPRAAIAWAVVAGAAPLAVLAGEAADGRIGWLTTFALGGPTAGWAAAATGVAAGSVLVTLAVRRSRAELAVLGLAVGALGLGTTWWTAAPSTGTSLVLAAAALLGTEAAATLLRTDRFWQPITTPLAVVAELLATVAIAVAILATLEVVTADVVDSTLGAPDPQLALALAITTVTWVLADLRRRTEDAQGTLVALLTGAGFGPALPAATLTALGAVAVLADPTALALALGAAAGLAICTGRPFAHTTVVASATLAPLAAGTEPVLAAGLGALGALLIAWAAALRVESADPRPGATEAIWSLAALTGLPVLSAVLVLADATGSLLPVLAGATVVLWLAAVVLDVGDRRELTTGLGLVARAASLLVLLPAGLSTREVGALAALLVALAVVESARRQDPDIALTAVVSLPVLVVTTGLTLGLQPPGAGLLLAAVAPVLLAALPWAPRTWWVTIGSLAGVSAAVSGLLVLDDPAASATWLLMVGGTVLALGVWARLAVIAWAGAGLLLTGTELHLSIAQVEAAEPYLIPVALLLVVAGAAARRSARRNDEAPVGSWLAYGPALALVGGVALLERITGGGPAHATLAGVTGVAAVVIGGWRRLAAPLFGGTALLVGVAAYESLAVTAALPTWMWLAAGGTVLLAAGILLERTATSPIEGGRRLVEVIGDRFE